MVPAHLLDRQFAANSYGNRWPPTPVEHPDSEVELALAGSGIARHLVEAAQQEVLRAGDRTRWGVAQAITWAAHRVNQNPDVRFEMERLAGEYLAGA